MHETEERMNHHQHHHQQHVHVRSTSSSSGSTSSRHSSSNHNGKAGHSNNNNNNNNSNSNTTSSTRMACEKASRRLRATLLKATRLGVTTSEIGGLPTAKKIVSQRDHDWKLAVLLLLMFGGGVIVALACTTSRGCTKIEDINLAT